MPEVTVSSLDATSQKQIENAQIALQRGNFDYVIDACNQVLKNQPGCLPVRKLQRAAQMRQYLAKNQGKAPSSGFTQPGFFFSGAKKDPAQSLLNAEKLLVIDPTSVPALKLLAEATAGLGLLETSAWAWECVHELQPADREALLKMGEGYLAAKKPKEANRAADILLKIRPQDAEGLVLKQKATGVPAA